MFSCRRSKEQFASFSPCVLSAGPSCASVWVISARRGRSPDVMNVQSSVDSSVGYFRHRAATRQPLHDDVSLDPGPHTQCSLVSALSTTYGCGECDEFTRCVAAALWYRVCLPVVHFSSRQFWIYGYYWYLLC